MSEKTRNQGESFPKACNYLFLNLSSFIPSPLKNLLFRFHISKNSRLFQTTPNKTWHPFSTLKRGWIRISGMWNWLLSAGWQDQHALGRRREPSLSVLVHLSWRGYSCRPDGSQRYQELLNGAEIKWEPQRLWLSMEQIRGNHKWRDVTAQEKIVRRALPAALTAVLCKMFLLFFFGGMQILQEWQSFPYSLLHSWIQFLRLSMDN